MGDITTIKLKKETKRQLAQIGTKEETYEDIVRRLLEFYGKNAKRS